MSCFVTSYAEGFRHGAISGTCFGVLSELWIIKPKTRISSIVKPQLNSSKGPHVKSMLMYNCRFPGLLSLVNLIIASTGIFWMIEPLLRQGSKCGIMDNWNIPLALFHGIFIKIQLEIVYCQEHFLKNVTFLCSSVKLDSPLNGENFQ